MGNSPDAASMSSAASATSDRSEQEDPKEKAKHLLRMADMVSSSACKTKRQINMGQYDDSRILDDVDLGREFGMGASLSDFAAADRVGVPGSDDGGDDDGSDNDDDDVKSDDAVREVGEEGAAAAPAAGAGETEVAAIRDDASSDVFRDASEREHSEMSEHEPDNEERALASRLSSGPGDEDGDGDGDGDGGRGGFAGEDPNRTVGSDGSGGSHGSDGSAVVVRKPSPDRGGRSAAAEGAEAKAGARGTAVPDTASREDRLKRSSSSRQSSRRKSPPGDRASAGGGRSGRSSLHPKDGKKRVEGGGSRRSSRTGGKSDGGGGDGDGDKSKRGSHKSTGSSSTSGRRVADDARSVSSHGSGGIFQASGNSNSNSIFNGDADALREQLEKARRALLQVRENASLKYRKLELEHSSLKKEVDKFKDKIERQSRQLKTKDAEVAHARKERDAAREELAREMGGRGSLVSGISQENGRMIRKMREMRTEREGLASENEDMRRRLGKCKCGSADGLDIGKRPVEVKHAHFADECGDQGAPARPSDPRRSSLFESMRSLDPGLDDEVKNTRAGSRAAIDRRRKTAPSPTPQTQDGAGAGAESARPSPRRQQPRPLAGGIFESMRHLAHDLDDEIDTATVKSAPPPRTGAMDTKRHGSGPGPSDGPTGEEEAARPRARGGPRQRSSIFESMRSLATDLSDEVGGAPSPRSGGRPGGAGDARGGRRGGGGGDDSDGVVHVAMSTRSLPTFIGSRAKEVWSSTSTRLLQETADGGGGAGGPAKRGGGDRGNGRVGRREYSPKGQEVTVDFPRSGRRKYQSGRGERRSRGTADDEQSAPGSVQSSAFNTIWSSTSTRFLNAMADEVSVS